jgi:hypothetical protein
MNRIENLLWICLFVQIQFSYAQTSSSNHFNHDTAYLRRFGYAQLNQTLAHFPKIKLDSTVSYDYDSLRNLKTVYRKRFCEYQDNFRTQIITEYDVTNQPNLKRIYEFNDNGQLLEIILYTFDRTTMGFKYYVKSSYRYDQKGNEIEFTNFKYEENGQSWLRTEALYSKYNSSNQLVEKISGVYNQPGDQWLPFIRDTFYYESNNFNNEFIRYEWDPIKNQYVNLYRLEFIKSNNLIVEKSYVWDTIQWKLGVIRENIFDSNSKLIQMKYVIMNDPYFSNGKTEYVETYKYNNDGFILENYRQNWRNNVASSDYLKKRHNYDSGNNEIFYSDEYMIDGKLKINYSYNQYFDNKISSKDIVGFPYIYPQYLSQIVRVENIKTEFDKHISNNIDYFYSPIGPNAIKNQEEQILFYPNPVTDYLFFASDVVNKNVDVQIIDMQGKVIVNKSNVLEDKIDLSGVVNGIYFLKIFNKNKLQSHRFIKISN